MSRLTLTKLRSAKQRGEKVAMLTVYDATFAGLLEAANVDVLLVGDSLGMVIQGQESTLPVTMDDMVYHCRNVLRGSRHAFILVDMPFMSYAVPAQAIDNAARLMREGGAQMVKLEGGQMLSETILQLTMRGIPVCAHLGLLPQSVHRVGGYRVQGREERVADQIYEDAVVLQQAGADMLILECIPAHLGRKITKALEIPVISCGAGPYCDGQVLVLYDMLGISLSRLPRFSHNFLEKTDSILNAVQSYVSAVKRGEFPTLEQSY
ncbi:3-methyl-2-oxobutanoate hydroxymethyltransferase [Candidatus Nitrosoglobus terrae]|uniref:3-methyl-2-oxobutanoate hydroxymethyltransferase n=1 Tax=Candidatus Nitrosoglobus terrae TaxID=1630141 RepID=A0A1Q2SL46_9GAMM|nr:3-methyl-2-oxobutanoate hydroxymethyltransferase [Candidatus Nitrosoglobus terrae]BAW79839.1 3-methyl-2-oxobutanoate hydroxymethyltransferase [Candidatus Nitrosoglobus terrae]